MPDLTLKMIIESGFIKPDTKVYASIDHKIVGNLNKDGSISIIVNNGLKTFPFPSGAAREFVNVSVNGWIFWEILDSGEYKSLAKCKQEFLNKK